MKTAAVRLHQMTSGLRIAALKAHKAQTDPIPKVVVDELDGEVPGLTRDEMLIAAMGELQDAALRLLVENTDDPGLLRRQFDELLRTVHGVPTLRAIPVVGRIVPDPVHGHRVVFNE